MNLVLAHLNSIAMFCYKVPIATLKDLNLRCGMQTHHHPVTSITQPTLS